MAVFEQWYQMHFGHLKILSPQYGQTPYVFEAQN